jgi:hypothetical protein
MSHFVADQISSTAFSITESADSKKLRLAKEKLAERQGSLYRITLYSHKSYIESLLTIDDSLKNALGVLGLAEERWKKLALMFFYLGAIRKLARESSDYTKKKPKYIREYMISNWPKENLLKDYIVTLIEALNFFNIRVEEWVEYGDAVIEMYDLYNNPDLKKFGFIDTIMPLEDNLHKI